VSTRLLIDRVLLGESIKSIFEDEDPTYKDNNVPTSQFVDGLSKLIDDAKAVDSDLDDLIADMQVFGKQSAQLDNYETNLSELQSASEMIDKFKFTLDRVLSWSKQNTPKLGN